MSLLLAHSAVIPVEAGAFAVLCKDFLLQTLAQSLRSLVRSARLHSLCSSHSSDSPVEAGASAVLCKNFIYRRYNRRYKF